MMRGVRLWCAVTRRLVGISSAPGSDPRRPVLGRHRLARSSPASARGTRRA